jgi:hypothetical protein
MIVMLLRRFNKQEEEVREFSSVIRKEFYYYLSAALWPLHSLRDRENHSFAELQNTRTLFVSEYLTQYWID